MPITEEQIHELLSIFSVKAPTAVSMNKLHLQNYGQFSIMMLSKKSLAQSILVHIYIKFKHRQNISLMFKVKMVATL